MSSAELIPTALATKLQPLLDDPVKHSHLYTKQTWVHEGERAIAFEIPAWTGEGSLWTQMRFTSSMRSAVSVDIHILGEGTAWSIGEGLGVEHREWTPLPWALPTAPLDKQSIVVQCNLPSQAGYNREEYICLEVLGFEHLYPPHKTDFVLADRQGVATGRFVYRRGALGVYVPSTERFVDEFQRQFLLPLTA